jgi:subfamily B ATP-binding cassette protein MsbA
VALVDVNVSFKPGEVVALVGKSGAGKSTFIALIPRFYDPAVRTCYLGRRGFAAGRQSRVARPHRPRAADAGALQCQHRRKHPHGPPQRHGRRSARRRAKAFVADFIDTLPQGYDTIVGERGASLSGGQRQRIAIARAFLKDAPILILDEAMSALDSESEAKIHQALQKLIQGRTTFMITHRFSSLSLANRILVFEDGRITGDGTAEELNRTHATFRRMTELQQLK